ncbi:MAG TPA: hypothetical protein VFO89_16645 [Thermoanaerobaculia bacterium]|nr:hypothetical protein [Thermoanaerobaculia bacterium]
MRDKSLEMQDYLDASGDASKRTRNIHFVMVIASVLIFAGLVNSLRSSWMLARLQASNDIDSPYVVSKIGKPPAGPSVTPEAIKSYEARYQEYYAALVVAYVENSFVIRVPVFGFTVDANDLGLIGGIGFVIILTVFLYSVTREVDNLSISFRVAEKLGREELSRFYDLLAMRQVFTVPLDETRPDARDRSRFALWIPKAFCFAPLAVHLGVTVHDILTADIGHQLSNTHTTVLFLCEFFIALILFALTIRIVARLQQLDTIWTDNWAKIRAPQNSGGLQVRQDTSI